MNKFEQSLQLSQSIEKNYNSLINQPIRTVDRYERGPSLAPNKKYLGQVFLSDSASVSSLPYQPVTSVATAIAPPITGVSSQQQPTTRMASGLSGQNDASLRDSNAKLQHMVLAEREQNYEKWIKKTAETPYTFVEFDKEPDFITSYRNLLFIVNEKSELKMISINSNDTFNQVSFLNMLFL